MPDTKQRLCDIIRDRNDKARSGWHPGKDAIKGETAWGERHWQAFNYPVKPQEACIAHLVMSAASYADTHLNTYGSRIGDDGVLGEHWADIVLAIRGLLNGHCGSLDCGTLDGILSDMLAAEGFDR